MEKMAIVIIGATLVGYALASAYKASEIRKLNCDKLKAQYEKTGNLPMALLALAGIIVIMAGVLSEQQQ
jgi:hypothetical protein